MGAPGAGGGAGAAGARAGGPPAGPGPGSAPPGGPGPPGGAGAGQGQGQGLLGAPPETRLAVALRLARRVYFPACVVFLSRAMATPIMPLYARRDLGASDAAVGLAGAGQGAGASSITLVAGFLVGRYGFTKVLSLGVLLCAAASFSAGAARAPWQLVLAQFLYGGGWGTLTLSIQFYIRMTVAGDLRGRFMSTLGTVYRLGNLAGPLLGGKMAHDLGFRQVYLAQGGLLLGLAPYQAALGLWARRRSRGGRAASSGTGFDPAGASRAPSRETYLAMLRGSARALLTAGVSALVIQVVRSSRDIVLPLKADDLGLSAVDVGSLTSASYLADLAVSPSSGFLMDRFGRKAAAVPALAVMAAGLLLVGLARDMRGLLLAGAVVGVGNGLTSGLVLCMGADLAPEAAVGEFLSLWRILSDGGTAVGPLVVGGLSSALSLGTAIRASAAVGFLGAAWTLLAVEETFKGAGRRAGGGLRGAGGKYVQLSSVELDGEEGAGGDGGGDPAPEGGGEAQLLGGPGVAGP